MTGTSYEAQYTFLITDRSVILRMRHVSSKGYKENQNTHFMFIKFFFRKSRHLQNNVDKYSGVRQGTDAIMAYEHCMLDN